MKKEVSQHFSLVGIPVGKYHFSNFGIIDLRNIDLDEAESLYNKGFPYLKKKKKRVKQEANPEK